MNGKEVKKTKRAPQMPTKAKTVVGDWQRSIVRLRGAVTACRNSGRGKNSFSVKLLLGLLAQVYCYVKAIGNKGSPRPMVKPKRQAV